MNELDERLMNCFQAVFPQMGAGEIHKATMTSVGEWDSMATITLVSLIEESFGLQTEPEDIEHLTSFAAIREYLQKKAALCDAR